MGLGESLEQRVEFALSLAREAVDSIPLNFLVPIPGTRLERMGTVKPLDILRTVSMFRLTNPRAEVKVCAGRVHLGDLQSMLFHAGQFHDDRAAPDGGRPKCGAGPSDAARSGDRVCILRRGSMKSSPSCAKKSRAPYSGLQRSRWENSLRGQEVPQFFIQRLPRACAPPLCNCHKPGIPRTRRLRRNGLDSLPAP